MVTKIESEDEFKEYVNTGEYCLVAFNARWSGPCKMMKPVLNSMSETYPTVKFCEVDVDDLESVSAEAGVSAMPTYMVYSWGRVIDQLVGAGKERLEALAKKYNALPTPPQPKYETVVESVDRSGDERLAVVQVQ